MVYGRKFRVKGFIIVNAAKQIIFIAAEYFVFVLGEKLTVIEPDKKRFIFYKRRK